jgi:hypothetical protein
MTDDTEPYAAKANRVAIRHPLGDEVAVLEIVSTGPPKQAFVEPVAVGDVLPPMPLFLAAEVHVPVPLEESYSRTFALCPEPLRELLESAATE